ncbi:uncharacterized protein [Halyomorpha halys]|uniref:uncharacterized protein isoform X2 n=1 Tax=Halyomorpha halys TaxID=286706 RepID=UPI0006D51A91|nr:uncharacterized protein LOC106683357 isoform X2 [Halyomorpha halys]
MESKMSTEGISNEPDFAEIKEVEKESLGTDKEDQDIEEKMEKEKIGKEWWDRNWVWHNRSPYVTGELMDKLEPYIKKLETTPAWKAYDKYFRSVGPFTEELSLEKRWNIARKWYQREDPKGFWKKVYEQVEKDRSIVYATGTDLRRMYRESVSL